MTTRITERETYHSRDHHAAGERPVSVDIDVPYDLITDDEDGEPQEYVYLPETRAAIDRAIIARLDTPEWRKHGQAIFRDLVGGDDLVYVYERSGWERAA